MTNAFFQTFCVSCEKPGPWVCADCEKDFPRVRHGHCSICGVPFANSKLVHPCFHCASKAPAYSKHRAPFYYSGAIEKLIKEFKYKADFWVRQFYQTAIERIKIEFREVDVIVPIPLHIDKLRTRGYNQSQLLAEVWQKTLQKPLNLSGFVRVENNPTAQVELNKIQRLKSLRSAFRVQNPQDFAGLNVLLVDDVHTTGSTLHTAASEIMGAQAKSVVATSFAIVRESN